MREYMKTVLNGLKQQIGNIKIPKVLPNPHPMRITGAVDVTYDGSKPVEVAIPQGGEQPDWNQNDSTANDYIKNRPFYDKDVIATLAEVTAEGTLFELPSAEYICGEEYIIEVNGIQYPMQLSWQYQYMDGYYYVGFNLKPGTMYNYDPVPESNVSFYLYASPWGGSNNRISQEPKNGDKFNFALSGVILTDISFPAYVKVLKERRGIKKIDAKYLPGPLILDANLSDYYGGHAEAGDEALEAIKTGRQILVRVPNADGENYTAIYCPIMMYQLPCNGYYLYLFYLRDEKQDLSALLGQPDGTVLMPTYGQFQMLLSKKYDSNPLEV